MIERVRAWVFRAQVSTARPNATRSPKPALIDHETKGTIPRRSPKLRGRRHPSGTLWRVLELAALERGASIVLIDVGPNLGALNRAALVAAEHVLNPLAPDLYSRQGLRNLGPALRRWRQEWSERRL